jgi:formylglycine-generating enzyme required for sulfatase activity
MIRTSLAATFIAAFSMFAVSHSQPDVGQERNTGEVIENSIGMKLIYIPPGQFIMGSPQSEHEQFKHDASGSGWAEQEVQHQVKIKKGFYLGVYTVTQEEYEIVMGMNPSYFRVDGKGKNQVAGLDTRRFPVEQVSWRDAQEFCKKLSIQEGKAYRLPTEAEWEFACRAGTATAFHFGATLSTDQANFHGAILSLFGNGKKREYRKRTMKVGSFPANGWGLHDMHGNVSQWCEDWYAQDYYRHSPENDPRNAKKGDYRVVRGGSWNDFTWNCRSASRSWDKPDDQGRYLGFRVACNSGE